MKKLQSLNKFAVVTIISIFLFALMSMPKQANAWWDNKITASSISIGQKKSFGFPAWHFYDLYFKPQRVGGWNLVASTQNIFQCNTDDSVIIEFNWRNGPNDSWHLWRTSTFSFWNKTQQWIYSGSSSIEFKFRLCHFMDSPTGVSISIR